MWERRSSGPALGHPRRQHRRVGKKGYRLGCARWWLIIIVVAVIPSKGTLCSLFPFHWVLGVYESRIFNGAIARLVICPRKRLHNVIVALRPQWIGTMSWASPRQYREVVRNVESRRPVGYAQPIEIAERELGRCIGVARRSHRELTFCSLSALKILGLPLPRHHRLSDDVSHVVIADQRMRSNISGVRFHVWNHPISTQTISLGTDVEHAVDHIRIVDPVTACMQMLAHCPKEECVVLFDAVMCRNSKMRLATKDELHERLDSLGKFHGCRAGRWALARSAEGVDSPMETRLRLRIVARGMPCPQVNVRVGNPDSDEFWFLDLAYPELKIGFEFQGAQFHATVEGLCRDSRKISALQGLGWRIVPVTAEMLKSERDRALLFATIDRIMALQRSQLHVV